MSEGRWRVFAAVPVPVETQLAIDRWRSGLGLPTGSPGSPGPARPVPVGNFHFTLRFAGTAGRTVAERWLAALDQAEKPAPFRAGLGGLGAFPKPSRAAVAWLGAEGGREGLERLAAVAEEAARAAGLPPEERPFHPHVTLARIRPPADLRAAGAGGRDEPSGSARVRLGVKMAVREMVLYRSFLGGKPARYEILETFPL